MGKTCCFSQMIWRALEMWRVLEQCRALRVNGNKDVTSSQTLLIAYDVELSPLTATTNCDHHPVTLKSPSNLLSLRNHFICSLFHLISASHSLHSLQDGARLIPAQLTVMGQSSSRQHRQPETPRNAPQNNETDDESHPANSSSPSALSSDPTVPPRAGPSRRASVRRSILNLVTPSARSRTDSNTNNLRKSWLSRRLSKAPSDAYTSPQLTDTPETPVETTSAASERGKDVSRGPDPSSADSIAGPSLHPIVSPSPDFPDNLEEVTECVRKEIVGNDLGQSAEGIPQEINPSEDVQAEVPITPELMPNLVTAVEQSTAIDEAAPSDSPVNLEDAPSDPRPTAQHAQPPGRPFPPPGTLVVVQGVVHTTDVPRPNALSTIATEAASAPRSSSVPPNSSNDNTRNRLSTLLRSRPASATAPDPPSSSDTTSLSGISTSQDFTSSPNNPPAEPSQAHPVPRTEPHSLANVHPPPIPTSSDSQPGTISSSSIDVLGTLLR